MKRFLYILISIVVLTGLAIYNYNAHPWIDVAQCMNDPENYDGKIVEKFREPMIGKILNDGFILKQKHGQSIRVYADTSGLKTGEYLGLTARFHKEGYLEAVKIKVSKYRRYKIWLSVIPVFFVLFLLIFNLKFNWKKFYFELKNNA
ncbi:hypothetical protein DRQ07_00330 [candidate division KSB1 bacterium]|nr:MAG: hypothetical protein DRQ07_00330 [candidate division KSB1 bacterium]